MNKLILKQIYIGAGVVILFIWMFVNIDCLSVYVPLMLTGIALTAIAVSLILYYVKKDMLEIPGKNFSDNNEITASKSFSSPVELNDIAFALEGMGYKVTDVYEDCINFNDENDKYCLYAYWRYTSQLNYLGVYLSYNISKDDVEYFSKIAQKVTEDLIVVKMKTSSSDDNTSYGLDILAGSFYSNIDSLNSTILVLMHFINTAMKRFQELRTQMKNEASTINLNDVQQQMALNQNKTKYEC